MLDNRRMLRGAEGIAMTDHTHKFQVGQTVDLIPSVSRFAANGHYEVVSLRPTDGEIPQYTIKSRREPHERVVSENDLILAGELSLDRA
jgi:hypothetical protein